MIKEIDFLDWASKNGYSATEVPMNIMEMILDFEKHVESKVKNLTIPRVTNWRFWNDNRNNRIVGFIVGLITGIAIYACL